MAGPIFDTQSGFARATMVLWTLSRFGAHKTSRSTDPENHFRDDIYYSSKEIHTSRHLWYPLHLRSYVEGYIQASSELKYLRFITGRQDLPFYYKAEVEIQRSFLDAFIKTGITLAGAADRAQGRRGGPQGRKLSQALQHPRMLLCFETVSTLKPVIVLVFGLISIFLHMSLEALQLFAGKEDKNEA
ncbi:uncharacterized protein P174DRAFT_423490 [Aspergillus novofumigatus IBT 16806]|uniref:Uncharacterized protein n=1 Tax=Aspergillus novofumigatus (strain IBT 16806) TaxID=1392255 RepID=A0A2I1BZ15_ASPN1|nr:uncharacterized protein P174DRAFT_423490 [Aspergillus novofumigatus IBT 16806]PKX90620.1 hypothetical protein P174DRAFT_423490 [Aspergillus novofumigatus IBT 16806]